ncbi:MAG: hypothetical protein WCZ87_13110, partial [Thiohalobacteraceae bacterium]
VAVDTLKDQSLPDLDGLFIGGGFPESCMERLEANTALRSAIHDAVEAGLPTYAECGGLMYLARSLRWGDRCAEMVGVIPGDIEMHERPQGRGYVRLRETAAMPWPPAPGRDVSGDESIGAHEFHYSALSNLAPGARFAFEVIRGAGIDGAHDGFLYKNLLACYTHQRDTRRHRWASRFVAFVRQHKTRTTGQDATSLH